MRTILLALVAAALFAVVLSAPATGANVVGFWGGTCTQRVATSNVTNEGVCTDKDIVFTFAIGFAPEGANVTFDVTELSTPSTDGTVTYSVAAQEFTSTLGYTVNANGTVFVHIATSPQTIDGCYYVDVTGKTMTVKGALSTQYQLPIAVCPTDTQIAAWAVGCEGDYNTYTCELTLVEAPVAAPVDTPVEAPVDTPTNTPTNTPTPVAGPVAEPSILDCPAKFISCNVEFAACSIGKSGVDTCPCWPAKIACLGVHCFADTLAGDAEEALCKATCTVDQCKAAGSLIQINWIAFLIALLVLAMYF